jgi:hypothetical protein
MKRLLFFLLLLAITLNLGWARARVFCRNCATCNRPPVSVPALNTQVAAEASTEVTEAPAAVVEVPAPAASTWTYATPVYAAPTVSRSFACSRSGGVAFAPVAATVRVATFPLRVFGGSRCTSRACVRRW